jgi:hypothetical protein
VEGPLSGWLIASAWRPSAAPLSCRGPMPACPPIARHSVSAIDRIAVHRDRQPVATPLPKPVALANGGLVVPLGPSSERAQLPAPIHACAALALLIRYRMVLESLETHHRSPRALCGHSKGNKHGDAGDIVQLSGYSLDRLRDDGEFILYCARAAETAGPSILLLVPSPSDCAAKRRSQ